MEWIGLLKFILLCLVVLILSPFILILSCLGIMHDKIFKVRARGERPPPNHTHKQTNTR